MSDLFNEEIISQATHTKWAGKTVHFAKETDSTNSWIKRLAKDGAEHGTLAVAEFQSAGRGRFDRRWERRRQLYYDDTALTSGIFTAVCIYADTGYGNGSGTGSRGTGV